MKYLPFDKKKEIPIPCQGRTFDGWHNRDCRKSASCKVQDDAGIVKCFCGNHDPIKKHKKNEEREALWKQERDRNKEKSDREKILNDLAKGIPTSQLMNYKLRPEQEIK